MSLLQSPRVSSEASSSPFECFTPVRLTPEGVECIDQRTLPTEEVYLTFSDWKSVAVAIKEMVVRGAPAI